MLLCTVTFEPDSRPAESSTAASSAAPLSVISAPPLSSHTRPACIANRPLFSHTYESLLPQTLYFDIDTNCRVPSPKTYLPLFCFTYPFYERVNRRNLTPNPRVLRVPMPLNPSLFGTATNSDTMAPKRCLIAPVNRRVAIKTRAARIRGKGRLGITLGPPRSPVRGAWG